MVLLVVVFMTVVVLNDVGGCGFFLYFIHLKKFSSS